MSVSHSPGRADEEKRIIAAKGWITEERLEDISLCVSVRIIICVRELYMGRLHVMDLNDPDIVTKVRDVKYHYFYYFVFIFLLLGK